MKLICGIKIAGMSLKTRKGDKVYFLLIFLFIFILLSFKIFGNCVVDNFSFFKYSDSDIKIDDGGWIDSN